MEYFKKAQSVKQKLAKKLEVGEISDAQKSCDFSMFEDSSQNEFNSIKKKTIRDGGQVENRLLFNEERGI